VGAVIDVGQKKRTRCLQCQVMGRSGTLPRKLLLHTASLSIPCRCPFQQSTATRPRRRRSCTSSKPNRKAETRRLRIQRHSAALAHHPHSLGPEELERWLHRSMSEPRAGAINTAPGSAAGETPRAPLPTGSGLPTPHVRERCRGFEAERRSGWPSDYNRDSGRCGAVWTPGDAGRASASVARAVDTRRACRGRLRACARANAQSISARTARMPAGRRALWLSDQGDIIL
jgi:hypothetical protein